MLTRFLLLFFLFFPVFANIQNYTYFCGFEQKCFESKSDGQTIEGSCCQPCECQDICEERETCCADKLGRIDAKNVIKQQCLPPKFTPKGFTVFQTHKFWYFVRTRCPATFTNFIVKEKCERENYESLEDVIFVSSDDGSNVYKNKFCALCNNEKRTLSWNVAISNRCLNHLTKGDVDANDVENILLSRCYLEFKRPDVVKLSTLCYNNKVSSCNVTGRWETYDENLEELCLNPPENVYYVTKNSRFVYSNIYCYLCNAPANARPETCQQLIEGRGTDNSFFSLIGFYKDQTVEDLLWSESNNLQNCKTDEIRDTFSGSCKRLYCPKLFLPRNGKCVRFAEGKFTFGQTIILKSRQRFNKTEYVKKELMSQYRDIILQLGYGRCEICSSYMFFKSNETDFEFSEIQLQIALTTKTVCNVERILRKQIRFQRSPVYVQISLNYTVIPFKLSAQPYEHTEFEIDDVIKNIGLFLECRSIDLDPGTVCARVKLTNEEFSRALTHHNNADKLVFFPNGDHVNDTVFVCTEDYIIEPQSSSGDKLYSVPSTRVLVLSACFVIIFRAETGLY